MAREHVDTRDELLVEVPLLKGRFSWEYLNALFAYDPLTGLVTRRVAKHGQPVGGVVGTKTKDGYLQVKVDGVAVYVHQLAHFLHTNTLTQVDHKGRNKTDNRISELRAATSSQNAANRRLLNSRNTSGARGVVWHKATKKWRAKVTKDGVEHYLGQFDCQREAALAYDKKALELFGEFAVLNEENLFS